MTCVWGDIIHEIHGAQNFVHESSQARLMTSVRRMRMQRSRSPTHRPLPITVHSNPIVTINTTRPSAHQSHPHPKAPTHLPSPTNTTLRSRPLCLTSTTTEILHYPFATNKHVCHARLLPHVPFRVHAHQHAPERWLLFPPAPTPLWPCFGITSRSPGERHYIRSSVIRTLGNFEQLRWQCE